MKDNQIEIRGPIVVVGDEDYKEYVEQYRMTRANINFKAIDNELKTMVITSASPSEGKSTTAVNLAATFANSGKKVLLVDADFRRPTVAKTFNVNNKKGLSTLLSSGKYRLEECFHESPITNLFILTSGPKPPDPAEMLNSKKMDILVEDLKKCFDLIIYDTPPVMVATEAQIMAAKANGVVLVVREGVTKKKAILKTNKTLEIAKVNIIGVVYNGVKYKRDYYY
ncbi:CpsD/CapB family tyrosine-protein kinase [Enterococcus faecium]|nr:tyrosine protein kinase [Enterococcus faecium]EME7096855.1 CpsD/CapB family tyrosine-protein kinase [Enterococcus faecium]EME7159938.1 CpsD/CapB family tyrosine-protein kinase [Enterococcus faecium]NTR92133.1 CpsD/CapB family tyrosine-protein kinase [Enterococcus faecium]